jgi:hypothetical protein
MQEAVWLVIEPSAPGIGGGTMMVGGRRCLHRAQCREATAQHMRGQGGRGGVHKWHWLFRSGGLLVVVAQSTIGEDDLGEEFLTEGARADGQRLTGGPLGCWGPHGSEGREGKGSGSASTRGLGRCGEFGPRRNKFPFLFPRNFPNTQE